MAKRRRSRRNSGGISPLVLILTLVVGIAVGSVGFLILSDSKDAPTTQNAPSQNIQAAQTAQNSATVPATVPVTTAPTVPATVSVASSRELPDFFHTAGSENYDTEGTHQQLSGNCEQVEFIADSHKYPEVPGQYVQILVNDYGYTIVDHEIVDKLNEAGKWYQETWYLQHPDAAVVGGDKLTSESGVAADVFVYMNQDLTYNWCTFRMQYTSDLTYTGTINPAPTPDPDPDPYKKDCWTCGMDGSCNTCGGSGRVWTYVAGTTERIQQRCTDAFCSGGRCNVCGGDGKK